MVQNNVRLLSSPLDNRFPGLSQLKLRPPGAMLLNSLRFIGIVYANFVWMISGFSCQSSTLTHIYGRQSVYASSDEIPPQYPYAYLAERAQSSQNTTANPSRVFALRRRKDLYPHVLHRQPLQLCQEAITESLRKGAAARKYDVAV